MYKKDVDIKASNPDNGKRLWEHSEELAKKMGIEFQKNIIQ
jgi:hypothetical protein